MGGVAASRGVCVRTRQLSMGWEGELLAPLSTHSRPISLLFCCTSRLSDQRKTLMSEENVAEWVSVVRKRRQSTDMVGLRRWSYLVVEEK